MSEVGSFHGVRCVGCGHIDKPAKNQAYLLDLRYIVFPCPECGGTEWEGWREDEASPRQGGA